MEIWGHGYAWLIDEAGIPHFRENCPEPVDLGCNLFVNAGESELAKVLVGQSLLYCRYMGLGTGITAADEADTGLATEVLPTNGLRRETQRVVAGAVASFETEWETQAYSSTQTFKEFGLFSASTGATMFDRIVYSTGLSKTTAQLLVVKIDIGFN